MDQYIGRLLDNRYEILEVIGTGGMAVVYKARCHRLNRLVAIKILKDEFAMDEEFRRRFHAEGEAVAMLSHPNIVQVYDVSTSDSANYIVMELIDGISLKQYMEKKGVLNWKETLHFSMQIAKALEHAHSRSIVHRDIKPHNVMVLKNGSVKVMDFGIARVMNKSNTLTKEALGSVHYISPEQAKGGHTDNRSDIYSLSVVMYEMMTGRPPYDGESAVSVAIQHINGGAPAPSTLNPNIPTGLEQIIMKGMALDVRDRYVSATEMLQEMEEFRKNPNIVFQHRFMVDDATRAIPGGQQTRTTAEKKAAQASPRATTDSIRLHQTGAIPQRRATGAIPVESDNAAIRRAQQRRKAEVRKKEEERSRVATTAIVICSAVAVVAIIIFLVALFNGALLNKERDYVDVPYLEGKVYSESFRTEYSDFTIREMPREYSETHLEGQVMRQQPAGGERVQRGTDLWLTISMGPEPEKKTMSNFTGADASEAYNLLKSQGLEPLNKKESSSVYDEGVVIRTDPASGEEVTEGQTVYIYVSAGPDVQTAPMPNTVGVELERVKELMEQMGFKKVRYEQMESQKPKNEVIYQSVAKGTDVDVNSEIIIHYSAGPQETVDETQPETQPEPTEQKVSVSWQVPDRPVEYRLEVCLSGTRDILASTMVAPHKTSVYLDLTGSGEQYFDLYIDGVFETTMFVDFG